MPSASVGSPICSCQRGAAKLGSSNAPGSDPRRSPRSHGAAVLTVEPLPSRRSPEHRCGLRRAGKLRKLPSARAIARSRNSDWARVESSRNRVHLVPDSPRSKREERLLSREHQGLGCTASGSKIGVEEARQRDDYVDCPIPMLARMFDKRLRGYQALGPLNLYRRSRAPFALLRTSSTWARLE